MPTINAEIIDVPGLDVTLGQQAGHLPVQLIPLPLGLISPTKGIANSVVLAELVPFPSGLVAKPLEGQANLSTYAQLVPLLIYPSEQAGHLPVQLVPFPSGLISVVEGYRAFHARVAMLATLLSATTSATLLALTATLQASVAVQVAGTAFLVIPATAQVALTTTLNAIVTARTAGLASLQSTATARTAGIATPNATATKLTALTASLVVSSYTVLVAGIASLQATGTSRTALLASLQATATRLAAATATLVYPGSAQVALTTGTFAFPANVAGTTTLNATGTQRSAATAKLNASASQLSALTASLTNSSVVLVALTPGTLAFPANVAGTATLQATGTARVALLASLSVTATAQVALTTGTFAFPANIALLASLEATATQRSALTAKLQATATRLSALTAMLVNTGTQLLALTPGTLAFPANVAGTATLQATGTKLLALTVTPVNVSTQLLALTTGTFAFPANVALTAKLQATGTQRVALLAPIAVTTSARAALTASPTPQGSARLAGISGTLVGIGIPRLAGIAKLNETGTTRIALTASIEYPGSQLMALTASPTPTYQQLMAADVTLNATGTRRVAGFAILATTIASTQRMALMALLGNQLNQRVALTASPTPTYVQLLALEASLQVSSHNRVALTARPAFLRSARMALTASPEPQGEMRVALLATLQPTGHQRLAGITKLQQTSLARMAGLTTLSYIPATLFARTAGVAILNRINVTARAPLSATLVLTTNDGSARVALRSQLQALTTARVAGLVTPVYQQFQRLAGLADLIFVRQALLAGVAELQANVEVRVALAAALQASAASQMAAEATLNSLQSARLAADADLQGVVGARLAGAAKLNATSTGLAACMGSLQATATSRAAAVATLQGTTRARAAALASLEATALGRIALRAAMQAPGQALVALQASLNSTVTSRVAATANLQGSGPIDPPARIALSITLQSIDNTSLVALTANPHYQERVPVAGITTLEATATQGMALAARLFPEVPVSSQSFLVKALEVPLPESVSDALGIHQSDVIIRTALLAAIADIRANPYLLDYIFASLPKDALTFQEYGEKEVRNAKQWFLENNIRVVMATQMNSGSALPCISIELAESREVQEEATLGDVHYQYIEDLGENSPWPDLTDPFTPVAFNAATGIFLLPDSTASQVNPNAGMVIVDQAGNQYQVTEVMDGETLVVSGASTNTNFRNCTIRGPKPAYVRHMESASFRETYNLGIHCHGEPVYLTYLHSIVQFILLRYKQVLLEERGFERSTFSSSEMARNAFFDVENVFSRFVSINGYVRQYWPKQIVPKITSVLLQLAIGEANETAPLVTPVDPEGNPDGAAALWIEDGDISSLPEDTSGYSIRGNSRSPGAPDNGRPGGPHGPAMQPEQNGQMASSTQNDGEAGTPAGNLTVVDTSGVPTSPDAEELD